MSKKIYIYIIFLLSALTVQAQVDRVSVAISYVEKGELTKAKASIDSTVLMPDYASDARAWYVRGFVYKEMFRKSFPEPKNIKLIGEESFNSFLQSDKLDTTIDNRKENAKNIQSLSVYFNNYAAKFLDSVNVNYAVSCMDNFKKCQLYINPQADFKARDIEFYNALASVYKGVYEKNISRATNDNVKKKLQEQYFQKAIDYYQKVLALDPNNYDGNYNQAILYYNEGAEMVNSMPIDADIMVVTEVSDKSSEIFKTSLPLMLKADELRPNRRETLIGLRQIYQVLYDDAKKMEYNDKLQALEKDK